MAASGVYYEEKIKAGPKRGREWPLVRAEPSSGYTVRTKINTSDIAWHAGIREVSPNSRIDTASYGGQRSRYSGLLQLPMLRLSNRR